MDGNILQDVSNAVSSLGTLGIQCPEYIVKLFLDAGEDPVQEIPKIYRAVTSAGCNCADFFERMVAGCQQYGSPQAFLNHVLKQAYTNALPDLENMIKGWGASARPPVDMLTEIDTLLARHPGFGVTQGSQGAMASAFMGQYTTIKGNIQKMAAPMSSSLPLTPQQPTYGPSLQEIWNKFNTQAEAQWNKDIQDGTVNLDLATAFILTCVFILEEVPVLAFVDFVTIETVVGPVAIDALAVVIDFLVFIILAMIFLGIMPFFIEMLLSILGLLVTALVALAGEIDVHLNALNAQKTLTRPGEWSTTQQQTMVGGLAKDVGTYRNEKAREYSEALAKNPALSYDKGKDPNKANGAGAILNILTSMGKWSQYEQYALGFPGGVHAEPQLINWAAGVLRQNAHLRKITTVNMLLYTYTDLCNRDPYYCEVQVFSNAWLNQLYNNLGYPNGEAWVFLHVWEGEIPVQVYSRGTDGLIYL